MADETQPEIEMAKLAARVRELESAMVDAGKAMTIAARGISEMVARHTALAKRVDVLERRGGLRVIQKDSAA
ncbi:MAG: hypothetical protein AB7P02_00035 [Alphaproteobacteria bacterium]